MRRLLYFILFSLGLFVSSDSFAKRQSLEFDECPYDGFPAIESFNGTSIVISEYKFNLARINHMIAFQKMLSLCNASSVVPLYMDWKQAQGLVIAKTAEASSYALDAALKVNAAETEEEMKAIQKDAAAKAIQFANELAPLVANAKLKKELFVSSYMVISSN